MNIGLKPFRYIITLPVSIILFTIGLLTQNLQMMNLGIILLWLNNILYALERPKERLFYMAFIITFFTFILGRTVARLLYDFKNYHFFSDEILIHTNACIFIALLSLYIGYIACERLRFSKSSAIRIKEPDQEERYSNQQYTSVRLVSKTLFFATYLFNILVAIEKAVFVSATGYAQYYVSYTSRFPYFLLKLGDVCIVAFFIFLSTMPLKKEAKLPIVLYMLSAIVGMFGGKRSQLVVPIIIMILYFAVRNRINRGESQWLTKKMIVALAIGTPFFLAFLYIFSFTRFGNQADITSFGERVAGFFDNLGFSVNVISYEKLYESRIPHKLYAIGDTIDYLRENVLTQLFFKFPVYKNQTIDKALYGNNFTQTITYLYSERYYLSGRGLGSCYIAEAYHDLGYIGIVLWSFIYCYALKNIYSFDNKGIIYNTMAFQALKFILEAPRTMASAFITEYINVNTWLVILVVFFAAKFLRRSTMHSIKNNSHAAGSVLYR